MKKILLLLFLWVLATGTSFSTISNITESSIEFPVQETVYVTKTGKKYHKANCQHLRQSKIRMNKSDAIRKGYTSCKHCQA